MRKEPCTTDEAESALYPRCFKCERPTKCAFTGNNPEEAWGAPWGVCMKGGGNFGSALYDSFIDPLRTGLEVILCDDCIEKNKHLVRETGVPFWGIKDEKGVLKQNSVVRLREELEEPKAGPFEICRVQWVNGKYVEMEKYEDSASTRWRIYKFAE